MTGVPLPRARTLRLAGLALLLAAGVALAVQRAPGQRPGTDFHAKWSAGKFFSAGEPVYVLRPDVRGPPSSNAFQPPT